MSRPEVKPEIKPEIKIDHIEYLLTVDSDRRVLLDGAIVIGDGTITHVGPSSELAEIDADRVIDATGMLATPGFINGHLHISYAHAVRGIFPDDVEGRLAHVFAMQSAMTADEEYVTTLLGLTEMLMTGTTTLVDPGTTRFPDACMAAYEAAGCRVITGEHVTDTDNDVNLPVYDTGEAIDRMEASVAALHGRCDGRMTAWTMPFSLDVCSPELLKAAKRIADEAGTSMTLHHQGAGDRTGSSPTARLAEISVLGPNVLLSHCPGLSGEEIDLLAATGTSVVLCPSTVIKAGGHIAGTGRLPELLDAGVNVSLGTDSVNSSNFIDLVRVMQLVATLYKDARSDTTLIPPETAIELATRVGAQALHIPEIGAIEVGRRGDVVLFDTMRPQWRGLIDPARNLVHSATGDSVDTVIVEGRVVVEAGRACFVDDLGDLIDRVDTAGRRIRARTGRSFPSAWPATRE